MTDQPNPAIVPEPEPPKARAYLVTGHAQETLGHQYGDTFTALLDPDQEAMLLAAGAIEIHEPAGPDPEPAPKPVADNDGDASDSEAVKAADQPRGAQRRPIPADITKEKQ